MRPRNGGLDTALRQLGIRWGGSSPPTAPYRQVLKHSTSISVESVSEHGNTRGNPRAKPDRLLHFQAAILHWLSLGAEILPRLDL